MRAHTGGSDYDALTSWLAQCRCQISKVPTRPRPTSFHFIPTHTLLQLEIATFADGQLRGVAATADIVEGEQLLSISERLGVRSAVFTF